jgi:diguanylate cyclase
VKSRLLLGYAAAQALAIGGYFFVPLDSLAHVAWQVALGWTTAGFALAGARREAQGRGPWYLFAAGIFLNATGPLVDAIIERWFGVVASPNLADAFWLGLFPGLIGGMGVLVYRRSLGSDFGTLALGTLTSTLTTTALGMLAWEIIIRPQAIDANVGVIDRMLVAAYPVGDLVVLALMLRLLLGGGMRNPALGLMLASMACFLGADVGWAVHVQRGLAVGSVLQHLLEMASLTAYALLGAAALHPAKQAVGTAADEAAPRASRPALVALGLSALSAPAVLAVEALLDLVYDVIS